MSPFESDVMALYMRKGGGPSDALQEPRVTIGGSSRM
jgi:hypothetical protein